MPVAHVGQARSAKRLAAKLIPAEPEIESLLGFLEPYLHRNESRARDVERDELEQRVAKLEAQLRDLQMARRTIVIKEVPRDEAKALVRSYYHQHGGKAIYPSDVAAALELDAHVVFEITNELVEAGELE